MEKLTPLMRQYWEIKSAHLDKLVFFRMGDFFELFFDDAIKAAPVLGIALTQRNKKSQDETPMCGFPHHAAAGAINKLLQKSFKIAICDQVEDPKFAKGLVKRAVTRILTPGMVYDPDNLEANKSHFIGAISGSNFTCVDTTTGEGFYFLDVESTRLQNLCLNLGIVELVYQDKSENVLDWKNDSNINILMSAFSLEKEDELNRFFNSDIVRNLPTSGLLLLSYLKSLANKEWSRILRPFTERRLSERMYLSTETLKHLEIFTSFSGDENLSFFHSICRTKTSAGTRLLRHFVNFPLQTRNEILERQKKLAQFKNDFSQLQDLRQKLGQMGDLQRRLSKISLPQVNARDLLGLANCMYSAQNILSGLQVNQREVLQIELNDKELRQCEYLSNKCLTQINPEASLSVRQGGIFNRNIYPQLDELIELTENSQSLLQDLETRERQRTGIGSLKVRYNNVFGYYIEVTHTHKDKIPSDYQRKQTLANAERFCTEELLELEKKILSAQGRRYDLEWSLFEDLRQELMAESDLILRIANACAEVDLYSSLAFLSFEKYYCTPEIVTDQSLDLKLSRHPVVEQILGPKFVANDLKLGPGTTIILTGPNMAGKSTLMRQIALTAILCQIGSDVPAQSAKLPIFDGIYTRIGASDHLAEGLSTFMVEMKETAFMLERASQKSLLLLDEVGRGTATYDGMALAQSILEYIQDKLSCQCLFATHYHELTDLENQLKNVINFHMKISELHGEIRFLYSLTNGPANRSYGIEVAELAGLPTSLIKRAKEVLKNLEGDSRDLQAFKRGETGSVEMIRTHGVESYAQLSFEDVAKTMLEKKHEVLINEIKNFPLMKSSPLEAMNQLAKWQNQCLGS